MKVQFFRKVHLFIKMLTYFRKDISKKVYNLEFLKKVQYLKLNIEKDLKRVHGLEKGPATIWKRSTVSHISKSRTEKNCNGSTNILRCQSGLLRVFALKSHDGPKETRRYGPPQIWATCVMSDIFRTSFWVSHKAHFDEKSINFLLTSLDQKGIFLSFRLKI